MKVENALEKEEYNLKTVIESAYDKNYEKCPITFF